jgi:hypothetical protein
MSDLFLVLMLLALLALILGLIKPGLVIFWGRKASRLQASLIYGVLVVAFFAAFGSIDRPPSQKANSSPAGQPTQAADAPSTGLTPEQRAVTTFQVDLMYVVTGIDAAQERFAATAQAMDSGQASPADLIRAAQAVEGACDRVWQELRDLKAPEDLSDDAEEACEKAANLMASALIDKRQAYDAFQDYVEERKPSQQKEFQDEMAFSNAAVREAQDALDQARQAVGLLTTAVLFASPEFKAWRGYVDGREAIMLEANRKFGSISEIPPDQFQVYDKKRSAYVEPKYQELAQKHYGAAGLDQDAIETRARDEQWMRLLREYS